MARSIGVAVLLTVLVGCGAPTNPPDSGVPDAGSMPPDAGTFDAGAPDAGAPDAGVNAGDAGIDAGTADAGLDGGIDAGTDAGIDAGVDAGVDAGPPPTGCRTGADCASGLCLPSGDCKNCQADSECGDGGACGTGLCNAPCGDGGACPADLTCCGGRCVDTSRDPAHCSGCTTACTATQLCGRGACLEADFAALCALPKATVMLNGVGEDETAGQRVGGAIVSTCTPPVDAGVAGQTDAGLLRASDGEPLALGELLVAGGGSFRQRSVRWLEDNDLALVRDRSTSTQVLYTLRDGGVVTDEPMANFGSTHDRLIIQLVRAPSGSVVINTAGLNGTGTLAAADFFVRNLLPNRASLNTRWYVVDWVDNDGTAGPSAGDTYTVTATGF